MCHDNSLKIERSVFKTDELPGATPEWKKTFQLGRFVKEYRHTIKIRLLSGGKKIGSTVTYTDDLLDPFNPGRRVYLLLEDVRGLDSYLVLSSLFRPSNGTVQRLQLDGEGHDEMEDALVASIRKKTEQVDRFGYRVPTGVFDPNMLLIEPAKVERKVIENQVPSFHSPNKSHMVKDMVDVLPETHNLNDKNP